MDAQEASLYIAILIAAAMVIIVLTFFIVTMIRYQRRILRLYKEKLAAEITTLEKERRRVSEDLHDELAPILAGIKLKLNSLDNLSVDDEATVENVHENLTRLMNRLRSISNDLVPAVLSRKGLRAALQLSADEINNTTGGLKVILDMDERITLSDSVSLNLYRICQEILANTLKHSKAMQLEIGLDLREGNIFFHTRDDGRGFDEAQVSERSEGNGLRNILNRTEMMGGKLFLQTNPGKGTHYQIKIPAQI